MTLYQQLQYIISLLNRLKKMEEKRQKLYDTAVSFLGVDASPRDLADDEYSCAESWHEVYKKAFGSYFIPTNRLSTYWLRNAFIKSSFFEKVDNPQDGDTIIATTGMGGTPAVPNGHVGIVGLNGIVMSSDSGTGKWLANYTITSFRRRYAEQGKFPVEFFRIV